MVSFGDILGLGGAVLSAFGSGKDKARDTPAKSISGFDSLPKEIQDYLLQDTFPKIQSYGSRGFEGIPVRRLRASDIDPIFGNQGLQDLQAINDEKARTMQLDDIIMNLINQQAPAKAETSNAIPSGSYGFNEAENYYQTPFGYIQGDLGRKAAEDHYLISQAQDIAMRGNTNKDQAQQRIANLMATIGARGESYDNPELGMKYSRQAVRDALARGDLGAAIEQGNIGNYKNANGFLTKFGPLLAGAMLATPALAGVAGLAGAATGPLQQGILNAGNWATRGISQLGTSLGGGN